MRGEKLGAKICGLRDPAGLLAAVEGGARFVGFVFYPPSPRFLSPSEAAKLASALPESVSPVAVFAEPSDEELTAVMNVLPNALVQLHGGESPNRVAEVRARFKCREAVAEWLLFDAKAPANKTKVLPGGNALAFDWNLLGCAKWQVPWLLSGGLTVANLAEAVSRTGARAVDVSSGVEDSPGQKNPDLIKAFLASAHAI